MHDLPVLTDILYGMHMGCFCYMRNLVYMVTYATCMVWLLTLIMLFGLVAFALCY